MYPILDCDTESLITDAFQILHGTLPLTSQNECER